MMTPVWYSLWTASAAALTVLGGITFFYRYFKRSKVTISRKIAEEAVRHFNIESLIQQKLEAWDFRKDIEGPLDQRLNGLVDSLKIQIPMAAMFLTGPLVDKLKGIAKEEIVKMIPEMKAKLFLRVKDEIDFKALIQQSVDTFFSTRFLPLLKQQMLLFGAGGAGIAFVYFGFLTWLIIKFF